MDIEILTYQDAVEHVLDRFDLARTARNLRMARRATLNAYRRFPQMHEWAYFKRRYLLTTEASYSTGTVSYDHTGGTYERELTLTTGTWPTNAALGVVVIDGAHYPVEDRKSSTVVTLVLNQNPGADVASGTTYVWYREGYSLPINAIKAGRLCEVDSTSNIELTYQSPEQAHAIARAYRETTDRPEYYTIRNDGKYYGDLALLLVPPPNTVKTYEYIFTARPRELKLEKENTGTVTISGSSTTVTGTGTAFAGAHVGCILRLSSSSTAPTSKAGTLDGTDNPYVAQRVITSVTNTTSLTIDAYASTSALTTVKYVISDPLDVEMAYIDALLGLMDAEFAMMANREDAGKCRVRSDELMLWAMDADRRSTAVQTVNDYVSEGSSLGDVTVT